MLTYDDCVGLSELTPEEIAAIARHEHLPEIVALEMGTCLCGTAEGKRLLWRMIVEDSEAACQQGDLRTAARLGLVLHHFLENHTHRREPTEPCPEAGATVPPWARAHGGLSDRDAAPVRDRPGSRPATLWTRDADSGDVLRGVH